MNLIAENKHDTLSVIFLSDSKHDRQLLWFKGFRLKWCIEIQHYVDFTAKISGCYIRNFLAPNFLARRMCSCVLFLALTMSLLSTHPEPALSSPAIILTCFSPDWDVRVQIGLSKQPWRKKLYVNPTIDGVIPSVWVGIPCFPTECQRRRILMLRLSRWETDGQTAGFSLDSERSKDESGKCWK